MIKLIKVTLSIAVLFVVVCVIGISALIFCMNPNKLRPIIAAEIQKQTGYKVIIDGNFSWSFYPTIGIKVAHIALLVPKQTVPFIELHNTTFVTEFSQLLHGNQQLRGDIDIAQVKLLNLHAQQVHVGLHWIGKKLILKPITADLYDGSLVGAAYGRELSALPRWEWNMQLSHIQLHPLLQDINGADGNLNMSGTGQIKLRASIQGKTREQILSSLTGTTEFSVDKGAIEGIDFNYLLQSADAIINKQPLPTLPAAPTQTTFDRLQGTAIITAGVATTTDLILTSPAFNISGAGKINVVAQDINLQLKITPQKDARTQWMIPVMITGGLYHPDARLDLTELNMMIAKAGLEKLKVKASETIKEHFSGKTGDLLQDLLGK